MKTLLLLLASSIAMAGGIAFAQQAAAPKGPAAAGPGPGRMFGWSLMSPQERTEHWQKMQSFERYDECSAYVADHHKLMQARAKEKGVTLPAAPMRDMCAHLKH